MLNWIRRLADRFKRWLINFIISWHAPHEVMQSPVYLRDSRRTTTVAAMKREACKRRNIQKRK